MLSPSEESHPRCETPLLTYSPLPPARGDAPPGGGWGKGRGPVSSSSKILSLPNAGEKLVWAVRVSFSLAPDSTLTASTLTGAHVPLTLRRTSCFSPFPSCPLSSVQSLAIVGDSKCTAFPEEAGDVPGVAGGSLVSSVSLKDWRVPERLVG